MSQDKAQTPPPSQASEKARVLEGDTLLHELRQGWAGLPNKTLFSLAMGGLRVRMMRSTVTMLSIVLAIAFLTYTGLSGSTSSSLVRAAEALANKAMGSSSSGATLSERTQRVAQADLLGKLDTQALKDEARLAGLAQISKDLNDQPIAQRTLARFRDDAAEREKDFNTAMNSSSIMSAERNHARSQYETAARQLAAAQKKYDELLTRIHMGKWVRSGELPADTTEAQMESSVRQHLQKLYGEMVLNISTPARLGDAELKLLDRPLTLGAQAGLEEDVTVLRDVVRRIEAQRDSENLLNMLRRSGVNIEKTLQGNPMDIWLIVMALMTCAVGIANAMLMSVTERFREIGTMKCLGAQDSLVVKLFLLESAFLGVVGAAGGIVIGVVVSLLASVLQYGTYGLTYFPVIDAIPTIIWSVLGGIILSVAGAVYPAYAASRMKPVDALRVDE